MLGGALVGLLVQWLYVRGIPMAREAIARRSGATTAASSAAAHPPKSDSGATPTALILEKMRTQEEKLRAQEFGETVERARRENLEAYQREIRLLGDRIDALGGKVDALAKSKTLSLQELQRAGARFKRLLDELEGIRDSMADTLKGPPLA